MEHSKKYDIEIIRDVEQPGSILEKYLSNLEILLKDKSKTIIALENKVLYIKNLIGKE